MIKNRLNILFIVEKIGPYHNARFNFLTSIKDFKITVIETDPLSKVYLWNEKIISNYKIYRIKNNYRGIKKILELNQQINQIFFDSKPTVIFLTGWYKKIHYLIINKSYLKKIPLILLSDSRYKDHKRFFLKEFIKKILLKNFSSAIVAGQESSNYLKKLQFKQRNIFKPYDVVDNDYFFKYNSKEKNVFSNYFLCIARFVKKKNHIKLLDAFNIYKQRGGNLKLLIIGFKSLSIFSSFKNNICSHFCKSSTKFDSLVA